ncbi:hypothetical protein K1X76_07090 [bacterium]|nr:hypothetical protein [bacterium]
MGNVEFYSGYSINTLVRELPSNIDAGVALEVFSIIDTNKDSIIDLSEAYASFGLVNPDDPDVFVRNNCSDTTAKLGIYPLNYNAPEKDAPPEMLYEANASQCNAQEYISFDPVDVLIYSAHGDVCSISETVLNTCPPLNESKAFIDAHAAIGILYVNWLYDQNLNEDADYMDPFCGQRPQDPESKPPSFSFDATQLEINIESQKYYYELVDRTLTGLVIHDCWLESLAQKGMAKEQREELASLLNMLLSPEREAVVYALQVLESFGVSRENLERDLNQLKAVQDAIQDDPRYMSLSKCRGYGEAVPSLWDVAREYTANSTLKEDDEVLDQKKRELTDEVFAFADTTGMASGYDAFDVIKAILDMENIAEEDFNKRAPVVLDHYILDHHFLSDY